MENNSGETMAVLIKNNFNLDAIAHLIIDNAELSYNGEDLRITNENTILQFIKYLYPNNYQDKIKELKTKE